MPQQAQPTPAKQLILRDYLAADRTVLANERTLLAYLRTTLTFLIGGATFLQFFDSVLIQVLGWAFLPAALVTALVGIRRFRAMKRALTRVVGPLPEIMEVVEGPDQE